MLTNMCSVYFEMLFRTQWTCASRNKALWHEDITFGEWLWRKTFRWAYCTCIAGLPNLKNTCFANCALFYLLKLGIRNSAVSLPSNRPNFHSGIILMLNCQMIETRSSDRWQHFSRPLGYALYLRYEVDWLICCSKTTAFWLTNKNNKAGYKKSCFVKMAISMSANRQLLRMKSTTKQENSRTLKRRVIFLI